MSYPREEVADTVERYHEMRRRIDAGEESGFGALADLYTEDAVYIDGAWGRIEGREAIAKWLDESMVGLGDWKFPIEFTAIEGNDVVVKWTQIIPGTRPDGTPYTPVRLLEAHLRGRRSLFLRRRHLQHGPRLRGSEGERLAADRADERSSSFTEPGLVDPEGLRLRLGSRPGPRHELCSIQLIRPSPVAVPMSSQ